LRLRNWGAKGGESFGLSCKRKKKQNVGALFIEEEKKDISEIVILLTFVLSVTIPFSA